jgi:hypothetical protein
MFKVLSRLTDRFIFKGLPLAGRIARRQINGQVYAVQPLRQMGRVRVPHSNYIFVVVINGVFSGVGNGLLCGCQCKVMLEVHRGLWNNCC